MADRDARTMDPLADLRHAIAAGASGTGAEAFTQSILRLRDAVLTTGGDAHWRLHAAAIDADAGAELLLERGQLAGGVSLHRLALALRQDLAQLQIDDPVFTDTVNMPVELAASHFAIAGAFKRAGAQAKALVEEQTALACLRADAASEGDPYALDTLAEHVEEAGRTAREIPDRSTMRTLFGESLALRAKAAELAPDDGDLARAFIEACVWRAPDLGRASAAWLDLARRMLAEREGTERHVPCTMRLRRLIDTAGAPSTNG